MISKDGFGRDQGVLPRALPILGPGLLGILAKSEQQIARPRTASHDRNAESFALASKVRNPGFPHDLLSQLLGQIRLRGEMVKKESLRAAKLRLEPGFGWVILVEVGEVQISSENAGLIELGAGDVLILSQTQGTSVACRDRAEVILGAFRFDGDSLFSMLTVLPSAIRIDSTERAARGEPDWISGLAHALLAEAKAPGPGASLMISRLIDVLVIRALRLWVQTAPPEQKGWLEALADARIGRAFKAIHDEPFRRWTVVDLAKRAGMSRSNFARRFTALAGSAPVHYQTRWRLHLAQDLLKNTDAKVGEAARQIGYESEAAFNRAYKAQYGRPFGAVRRDR